MKNLIALILGLLVGTVFMFLLDGCASAPKPGERGYTVTEHYDSSNAGWHSSYHHY